jgi:hypothetical protein
MICLENVTAYRNLQFSVLTGTCRRSNLAVAQEHGRAYPVLYPAFAMGATGRLYSGKFRAAPASSSGQP